MVSIERWKTFPKRQQLLMIGSELARAKVWQQRSHENFLAALERGLDLVDLSINDSRWKGEYGILLGLREEMAKFYAGLRKDDIGVLYDAL